MKKAIFDLHLFSRDILDVWFDSGITWNCVIPKRVEKDSFKQADLYLEGLDQFSG